MEKTNLVMLIVMALLLVFSVVQAAQINELKEEIDAGGSISDAAVASQSAASVRVQPPSQPAMVGGC